MESLSLGETLLKLAAQAAGPLAAAGFQALGVPLPIGFAIGRAIGYFAPAILKSWQDWGASKSGEEWEQALDELGAIPSVRARDICRDVILVAAPASTEADQRTAINYVSAIPACVHQSAFRDPELGRITLPPDSERMTQLLQLLPLDPTPFAAPCPFPETPYFLEELVGVGAFGAVYRAGLAAEQYNARALKLCLNVSVLPELQREQKLLERLREDGNEDWPRGIVRLYGYRLTTQPAFLVYEFIAGSDLGKLVTWKKLRTGVSLPPDRILDFIRQIAEALSYIHDRGLVHRDLKPANILVDKSGSVHVTDFGIGGLIAEQTVNERTLTSTALVASTLMDQATLQRGGGTPLYMSLEQHLGEPPAPHHDIYSLGVIWFQLLAGDVGRPIHPGWEDELLEEHNAPREHVALIRACVGYVKHRPANAKELLEQLPGHTPHPSSSRTSTSNSPRTLVGHGSAVNTVAISTNGRHVLSGAHDGSVLLWDVAGGKLLQHFEGHKGPVTSVAFSPDDSLAISGSMDKTLRVWSLKEGHEIGCFSGYLSGISAVAFLANGKKIASAGRGSSSDRFDQFILLDLETRNELLSMGGNEPIRSMALVKQMQWVLLVRNRGLLQLWDIEERRVLWQRTAYAGSMSSITVSRDGERCLSVGSTGRLTSTAAVHLWDVRSGRPLHRLTRLKSDVVSGALSPDGLYAACGGQEGILSLWNLQSGTEVYRTRAHTGAIHTLAFSANGRQLVTGSDDQTIRQWPVVLPLESHEGVQEIR